MGKIVLVAIATWALACCVVCEVDLQKFLTRIPEAERVNFLRYHAMKGYSLETEGQELDYEQGLPDQFSIDVYRTLLKGAIDGANNPLSCIICWADGRCVDLCDPGVHPV